MRQRAMLYGARAAAVWAALALASAPSGAQAPARARAFANDPSGIAARTVAARWKVAPESVRFEWLDPRDSAAPAPAIAARPAGDPAAGPEWLITLADGARARRVRAGVLIAEPHAARDIARGSTLGAADIAADSVVRWGAPPPSASREIAAAGWVAHSTILAGALLRAPAVTPPPAVHAGDTVRVIWRGASVVASARGRAAATVAPGEAVAVRLDNGQRIEGRALRPGWVLIP